MGLGQDRAWDAPVCSVREVAAYVRVMWTLCAHSVEDRAGRDVRPRCLGARSCAAVWGLDRAVVARGRLSSKTRGGVRRVLALPSSASASQEKSVHSWGAGRAELGEVRGVAACSV